MYTMPYVGVDSLTFSIKTYSHLLDGCFHMYLVNLLCAYEKVKLMSAELSKMLSLQGEK